MIFQINIIVLSYTAIFITTILAVMVCFVSFLKYNLKLNKENKKEVRNKSYSH